MSIFEGIKLSRIQLSVIGILFTLILIFAMKFSVNDKNNQSQTSENADQQDKSEQIQILSSSLKVSTEYESSQESMTSKHHSVEFPEALPLASQYSTLDATANNPLSSLDDESLLNVSDVLENSLVPVFLSNSEALDIRFEQKAAIDVFVSRLPEDLSDSDFQKINSLLRDYLPYDVADILAQKIEQTYQLHEREQAYLSSALANNKSAETMTEQILIGMHLASLKDEEVQQEPEFDLEPSEAFLDWQKTEEKFKEIQSTSTNPNQDIHEAITHDYGAEVADDYLELANAELQWIEKYDAFLIEKSIIRDSGLSETDKTEQIESLIQQYYQENEWAAARAYDAMMQARPEE